jgi:hypothetical protein
MSRLLMRRKNIAMTQHYRQKSKIKKSKPKPKPIVQTPLGLIPMPRPAQRNLEDEIAAAEGDVDVPPAYEAEEVVPGLEV